MRGAPAVALFFFVTTAFGAEVETSWHHQLVDGVSVKSREVTPGTFEVIADGLIDANVQDIEDVLTRVNEYPRFMPYVKETRVLRKRGATTLSYTRIGFQMLFEPRDWVTETTVHQSSKTTNGFHLTFTARPDELPEQEGVVRVTVNEGEWIAEGAGAKTRVFYCFTVAPGGTLPSFTQEFARREGVLKLFSAIEQEANERAFKRRTYSRIRAARAKAAQRR